LNRLNPLIRTQIDASKKAKLIFIVPPDRFNTFTSQKYIVPDEKSSRSNMDNIEHEKPIAREIPTKPSKLKKSKSSAALNIKITNVAAANPSIVPTNKKDVKKEVDEIMCWIEQYVLEVDVSPMTDLINTFRKGGQK
jgi:hypothetical protein